jgi:DNA mismatch endonuclease, patch repair protein
MADNVSSLVRSRMMSAVRGRHTRPERYVRKLLHAAGFRFRLHRSDLPGSPDVTLPAYNTVVFVNGCFWHGHDCLRGRLPSSNVKFWRRKIGGNARRDAANETALKALGWKVAYVWQCQLRSDTAVLLKYLRNRRQRERSRESAR